LTSWFYTSGLWNWERIDFCCFKTPTLWCLVMAALGEEHLPPFSIFKANKGRSSLSDTGISHTLIFSHILLWP
jgi:hypothetical protein